MPNVYELPLSERFEAANEQFRAIFARKARLSRTGVCSYPSDEVMRDLYAVAGEHGLFAHALWCYFWALYDPDP